MKDKKLKCSICEGEHDDPYGHNAEPINNGKCCSVCNSDVVLPTRIRLMFSNKDATVAEDIIAKIKRFKKRYGGE
tara:strand:+ start:379 stop:603 length:225 start_codon:yes stop_codon:yes gene_type:complete